MLITQSSQFSLWSPDVQFKKREKKSETQLMGFNRNLIQWNTAMLFCYSSFPFLLGNSQVSTRDLHEKPTPVVCWSQTLCNYKFKPEDWRLGRKSKDESRAYFCVVSRCMVVGMGCGRGHGHGACPSMQGHGQWGLAMLPLRDRCRILTRAILL